MPIVEINATLAGDSTTEVSANMLYEALASWASGATSDFDPDLSDTESLTMDGESTLTATLHLLLPSAFMAPVGTSSLTIDAAKVLVLSQPKPVKEASPVVVPVVRVTASRPQAPQFGGVPTPTNKRKKGL